MGKKEEIEQKHMKIVNAIKLQKIEKDKVIPNKSAINELWNRLGEIKVQCPKCGLVQACRSLKRKCIGCNRSFSVCPDGKKSRIVYCDSKRVYYLHQIISLELDGKYMTY
jgi:hypothetical protein